MNAQAEINKKDIMSILDGYCLKHPVMIKKIDTSGNIAFLVMAGKSRYFLRLCGDGLRWRDKKEIEGELDLVDRLKKSGLPVPNYLKTAAGSRVVGIGNRYGYLREYITGRQGSGSPIGAQVFAVGKFLGRMHRIVRNYDAGGSRKNIDFGIEKTKRYFHREKKNILKSNFGRSHEFVRVWQEEMEGIRLPGNLSKGMIHEDLGKRHVFWQKNKIKAVIDFDRCYYGYLLLDLGQALRGWCFNGNWRRWNKENFKRFMAGYAPERKLPARERKYLLSAVKFAILERALAYCTKYVYGTRQEKRDEKFSHDSLFRQIKLIEI